MSAWTPAEDAALRARCVSDGATACASDLNRSRLAVQHRAKRLGIVRVRRWTQHDDARLTVLWGEHAIPKIAARLDRTADAVYWRARELRLGLGCPRGAEYITRAAERTGYAVASLRLILRWAGVRIERATTRPDAVRRGTQARAHLTHVVDPYDVDAAVARWCATETLDAAADSRDMCSATLARLLREAAARGDDRVPPKPHGFRKHWRIPSALADQLVAAYRDRESLEAASMRVGVDRRTLHGWLTRAGVSVVRVAKLAPSDVDRVVAERLADPRCKSPRRAAA
jgi:hypothetical protein